jgi:hypothetical protein
LPLVATTASNGTGARASASMSAMPLPSGSPRSTITTFGRKIARCRCAAARLSARRSRAPLSAAKSRSASDAARLSSISRMVTPKSGLMGWPDGPPRLTGMSLMIATLLDHYADVIRTAAMMKARLTAAPRAAATRTPVGRRRGGARSCKPLARSVALRVAGPAGRTSNWKIECS